MTATLTQWHHQGTQFFTDTGVPLAGGSLLYQAAGTSSSQAVYSDPAGSNSLGSVVTLNAYGRLTTPVYLGTANDYKETLRTSTGATVNPWPTDDIPKTPTATAVSPTAIAVWINASISTTPVSMIAAQLIGIITNVDSSSNSIALTLPSAVTVGNGGQGIIAKTVAANTVTISTSGGQTINGAASITLTTANESVLIISDGANYRALKTYADGAIAGSQLSATAFSGLSSETAAAASRSADRLPLYSSASGGNASIAPQYVETARYPSVQSGSIVVNMTTATPPGSPVEFASYVVYAGATGAWSGQTNNIAMYVNAAWKFFTPSAGWEIYDVATMTWWTWNGTAWVAGLGFSTAQLFTTPFGATFKFGFFEEEITLSGATTDSANVLPNQSVVFGVACRVTALITASGGGASFSVGPVSGGGAGDWGAGISFAAGTTNQGVSIQNHYGEKVRITINTGAFTGGKVRITALYAQISAATS
jgi:hypothetical protein